MLRSFFRFTPEEVGYIGWTQEAGRKHVMEKITPSDLILIYGAGSGNTDPSQKLRILGFLQVDPTPIRDVDKASQAGMERKVGNGWEDTYALNV